MHTQVASAIVLIGCWSASGCGPTPTPIDGFHGDFRTDDLPPGFVEDLAAGAGDMREAATLCSLATPVTCGINNTGRSARAVADAYDCTPELTADVSGPEVAYSWTATSGGGSDVQLEATSGATLVLLDASTGAQCATSCLAVGVETAPGTFNIHFTALAGHRYLAVAESPAGGSIAGYKLYWNCP